MKCALDHGKETESINTRKVLLHKLINDALAMHKPCVVLEEAYSVV